MAARPSGLRQRTFFFFPHMGHPALLAGGIGSLAKTFIRRPHPRRANFLESLAILRKSGDGTRSGPSLRLNLTMLCPAAVKVTLCLTTRELSHSTRLQHGRRPRGINRPSRSCDDQFDVIFQQVDSSEPTSLRSYAGRTLNQATIDACDPARHSLQISLTSAGRTLENVAIPQWSARHRAADTYWASEYGRCGGREPTSAGVVHAVTTPMD